MEGDSRPSCSGSNSDVCKEACDCSQNNARDVNHVGSLGEAGKFTANRIKRCSIAANSQSKKQYSDGCKTRDVYKVV